LDPKRIENVKWKKTKEVVMWVSQRRRQRELLFIACRAYLHIRVEHQILVNDLHDLFEIPSKQLRHKILAIDRKS
jgi:hypothetical protein